MLTLDKYYATSHAVAVSGEAANIRLYTQQHDVLLTYLASYTARYPLPRSIHRTYAYVAYLVNTLGIADTMLTSLHGDRHYCLYKHVSAKRVSPRYYANIDVLNTYLAAYVDRYGNGAPWHYEPLARVNTYAQWLIHDCYVVNDVHVRLLADGHMLSAAQSIITASRLLKHVT